MNTIGFVLLHEYTHWETLMSPVMLPAFQEKATLDEAIGPWKVRQLTRHQATWNADSYAWLAQEIWWTQTCRGTHGPLEEPEEKDN
jgi:tRNA A37 N6-isopentenylltransferase MiaA